MTVTTGARGVYAPLCFWESRCDCCLPAVPRFRLPDYRLFKNKTTRNKITACPFPCQWELDPGNQEIWPFRSSSLKNKNESLPSWYANGIYSCFSPCCKGRKYLACKVLAHPFLWFLAVSMAGPRCVSGWLTVFSFHLKRGSIKLRAYFVKHWCIFLLSPHTLEGKFNPRISDCLH